MSVSSPQHRIILTGPPASGKGSQAKRLAERFGLRHLSTGAAIRDHMERGTELGERCRANMNAAKLVSDEIAMEVVISELSVQSGGFILDGFPRTIAQAQMLDRWLAERGQAITIAIALGVPEAELEDRVLARVVCSVCGHPFRIGGAVADLNDACPDCGGELKRRSDDSVKLFRQRMAEFRELTLPAIEHYDRLGVLQWVDGSAMPDDVFETILSLLLPAFSAS